MRRVDLWGLAVAAVAGIVFLLHGFGGVLSRDLALYAYAGQQFAEGTPPYEGVLNRAGPLAHMVPGVGAIIARQLGTDDLLTMRVVMFLLTLVAVWLTYLLGRDMFGDRAAGVAAAVTLLASRAVVLYAGGGPREKTTMMLLVICVLFAVVHRRWVWAGVATALATLTWQPAFVLCLTVAVVAAAVPPWREHWRGTLRAWAAFAGGGLLATAAMCLYFASVGALPSFFEGFLSINATKTRQFGLVFYLREFAPVMSRALGWSLWLLLAGLLASVVLALRFRGSSDGPGRAVVGVGVATIVCLAWSFYAFNGWADAVFVIPLSAVGLAGGLLLTARRLPGRTAVGALGTYAVVVAVAAAGTAWSRSPDSLSPVRSQVEEMMQVAGPDVTVQSIGAPQPLVLAGLRNPIRHQMFLTGLKEYVDETEPGGIEGITADIERRRPTFITVDHPSWYDWLHPVLDRNYVLVGFSNRFVWYADRTLDPDDIRQMRAILAANP